MTGFELISWWMEKGSRYLNKIMIEIIGKGLGYVPLNNLLSDCCELSQSQLKELYPVIAEDGGRLKFVRDGNGNENIYIYVK